MKKLLVLLMVLVMVVSLLGCNRSDNSQDLNSNVDIAAMTEKSKNFADALFQEHLNSESEGDYEIEHTSYGFIISDPLAFMIGYEYTVDGTQYVYGYKLGLNENLTFNVIEEGESVGKFVLCD